MTRLKTFTVTLAAAFAVLAGAASADVANGNLLRGQRTEGPGAKCDPDSFDFLGAIFHFPPAG